MILGIKGNDDKGQDVIKALEMIGGINKSNYRGVGVYTYYYIDPITNDIKTTINKNKLHTMTLEEFNKEYPYRKGDTVKLKEGDKVVITDIRWDGFEGAILYKAKSIIITNKEYYCIDNNLIDSLLVKVSSADNDDNDEAINSAGNPIYDTYAKRNKIRVTNKDYQDKVELELCGYELKQEDGKFFLNRSSEYPATYEKCCEILGLDEDECDINVDIVNIEASSEYKVFESFIKLIRCRDAYWKLHNNWKPNPDEQNYSIRSFRGKVVKVYTFGCSSAFEFPNEEICDNFLAFFNDDIELCKELL